MKIFISHGSHDVWIASQMRRAINELGVQTFLDAYDLQSGDRFRDRIKLEIRASDELVVLLTPFSRQRTWLANEVGMAEMLEKRIVPFLYGVTRDDLTRDGGLGLLEPLRLRELVEFDVYLAELKARIGDAR
jgi:hypothetical protein